MHGIGVEGVTIAEVRGHGRQKGHTETYRGNEYTVDLLPKVKLDLIVADSRAKQIVETIIAAAKRARAFSNTAFGSPAPGSTIYAASLPLSSELCKI